MRPQGQMCRRRVLRKVSMGLQWRLLVQRWLVQTVWQWLLTGRPSLKMAQRSLALPCLLQVRWCCRREQLLLRWVPTLNLLVRQSMWLVPSGLLTGRWSQLVLLCFQLALQSPLMARLLPRRVQLWCRLALRWLLSMVPSLREHQWRQQEQWWMLLVLLWWVLRVQLVLVLGSRRCQLESVSMLKVRLFQVDHPLG